MGRQSSIIYLDDWMAGGDGHNAKRAAKGAPECGATGDGGGSAPVPVADAPAQMARTRSSYVRKGGGVDANTLRLNEQMNKMVALQAANVSQKKVQSEGGLFGKVVDFGIKHKALGPKESSGMGSSRSVLGIGKVLGSGASKKPASVTCGGSASTSSGAGAEGGKPVTRNNSFMKKMKLFGGGAARKLPDAPQSNVGAGGQRTFGV